MADNVRVRLISKGMQELLNDEGVRAELEHRASRVLSAAITAAPSRTGDYKASLHIIHGTTDRAAVAVGSDDPGALAIEARTGNLARALGAAGGGA